MAGGCDIAAEWDAALSHARIKAGCARYWVMEDLGADTGANAVWFRPGDELIQNDHFPDAAKREEANRAENVNLHRIAVKPCHDAAVLAARLRHELEHARQYDSLGPKLFDLYDLVHGAILKHRARGARCTGDLVNSIPADLDANAAASMHLADRHPAAAAAMCCSDHRYLACSRRGPEPFETLPARMVAFAYVHRGCMQDDVPSGSSLKEQLDRCYEGAWELWRKADVILGEPWQFPVVNCPEGPSTG